MWEEKNAQQNHGAKCKKRAQQICPALSHGETLLYLTALKSQLFELVEFKFSTMIALCCRRRRRRPRRLRASFSLSRLLRLYFVGSFKPLSLSLVFYYDKFLGSNALQELSGKQ